MPSADLTLRSDVRALPPGSGEGAATLLLSTEAGRAAWRLVEAFSLAGAPFELELQWSAGSGSGAGARVTVPSASRICIFARSLTLRATDLSGGGHEVGVTVADGFDPTRNVWEHRGEIAGVPGGGVGGDLDLDLPMSDLDVDIDAEPIALVSLPRPAFGRRLWLRISAPERLDDCQVELRGPQGRVMARIPGAVAMTEGVALGGAARILLRTPAPMAYSVIYGLSL